MLFLALQSRKNDDSTDYFQLLCTKFCADKTMPSALISHIKNIELLSFFTPLLQSQNNFALQDTKERNVLHYLFVARGEKNCVPFNYLRSLLLFERNLFLPKGLTQTESNNLTPIESYLHLNIQGIVFALIASLGASIMIVTNQAMSRKNISPIQINIFINFFNTIFFFIILSLFFKIDTDVSLNAFFILLIPSCSYAIALFLQLLAIPRIGQTNTALFLYLEPITGIFGAVLILNEKLSSLQLLGIVIVLISLATSTFVTRKT